MKKLRYVGRLQRKVLYALIDKPLTKIGVIHSTGLSPNNVDVALKSLIFKEIVCRDGIHFKISEDNEDTTQPTASANAVSAPAAPKPIFVWDVKEGQRDFKSTVCDTGERRTDIVSAN